MRPKPSVSAIDERDVREIAEFLHANLNQRFSVEAWMNSLSHPWAASRPNLGMQLRDGDRLVGVLLAIYSDQEIDGKTERICNPHSWYVLEEYRNHGIGLVLAAIKQPGYHFTMLTPNPKVAEIFRHLRFKDLATGVTSFTNLSLPVVSGWGESDAERIALRLRGSALRAYQLHRSIPWLRFVAFGSGEDACLVAFKPCRLKKLPCARIIHVSDPGVFEKHHPALRWMLLKYGLMLSQVETRFLLRPPPLSWQSARTQNKLFLSKTLRDSQIADLYSELAALDV